MTEAAIEILASLVFDSWMEPGPELRADRSKDRHLIYEAGDIILDLLVKKVEKGESLQVGGQVLPNEESLSAVSDVEVRLQQGKHRYSTHTNALGEFAFSTFDDEAFDLSISLHNRRFWVRGLSSPEPKQWRVVPSLAYGGD